MLTFGSRAVDLLSIDLVRNDGTATLVTGGKLVEGTKDGDNWRGKSIEGGKAQKMSKGDFMLVPAGSPHWFTDINGQITEFSLHLPVK